MAGSARSAVLDDETALDGPRIDVAVRVGWLLRTARRLALAEPVSLEDMAERVGTNPTRLHRIETGRLRSGRVVDGYERGLGLPAGALRGPIDVICRGFAYAPADRDPGEPVDSVREMTALTDRVGAPAPVGGDWLAWAGALSQPGAIGLPEPTARALVHRLVGELQRSVSHAYPARYEALSRLRCSAYGHVVLDVAQEVVADPNVRVVYDLMSAVGEAATPDAVAWCLALLAHDSELLVTGGALALENLGEVTGDPAYWAGLVGPLLDLLEEHGDETVQHRVVSHLLRLVPARVLAASGRRPARELAATADMPNWTRTRLNRHWSDCQLRARAVTNELDLPEQPVLARLIFDIAMGPHESRAVSGYMLLGAVRPMRRLVGEHVAELADAHPDPVVRDRASRRLAGMLHGEPSTLGERWLASDDPEDRDRGLVLAGAAGVLVPEPLLRESFADGGLGMPLYAAGMTQHPALPVFAGDPSLAAEVRGGARWWLSVGGRVAD